MAKPLGQDFRKTVSREPPRRNPAQSARVEDSPAPPAGTRDPLVIEFNEPLDHALLERVLTVANAAGEEVLGEITSRPSRNPLAFYPEKPWSAGKHELVVAGILEDLAGNSLGRKFEVRLENSAQEVPPGGANLLSGRTLKS